MLDMLLLAVNIAGTTGGVLTLFIFAHFLVDWAKERWSTRTSRRDVSVYQRGVNEEGKPTWHRIR
jgi:hypothetical protein